MKLISKIKKALWGVGMFFITLSNKIYAASFWDEGVTEALYGIPNEISELYGVPQAPTDKIVDIIEVLTKFIGIIFIPLILILGIIAYVKKGKDSKVAKIFRVILIIAVISLILLLVGLWIYKMIF